jgi:hypothetical protein
LSRADRGREGTGCALGDRDGRRLETTEGGWGNGAVDREDEITPGGTEKANREGVSGFEGHGSIHGEDWLHSHLWGLKDNVVKLPREDNHRAI